ncbi:MAG: hypothetical protein SF028_03015 [Candidatus Sumerlaeia bacterium]|nr:hypothetical protein [Candidatus Sumerlaeia bacterium]
MAIVLSIAVIAALLVAFGHESLEFSLARRRGDLAPKHFLRFRRRTLGLFLVAALTLLLAFMGLAEKKAMGDHGALLGYYGVCILVAGWILLVALRDMRIMALDALTEKQRITMEHLEDFERLMVERAAESKRGREADARGPMPVPPQTARERSHWRRPVPARAKRGRGKG